MQIHFKNLFFGEEGNYLAMAMCAPDVINKNAWWNIELPLRDLGLFVMPEMAGIIKVSGTTFQHSIC